MTIKESLLFQFNGEHCVDYGVMNVSLDSGMLEEPFTPSRSLREQKIKGNHKPYFMGVDYEPLTIPLQLAFSEGFNIEKLRKLSNWLTTDRYEPLIFETKPSHIYYATLVDDGNLVHNAASQGYINITFRCDSPWAWTPAYSQHYDFSANTANGTLYTINNVGDLPVQPELQVELVSGTEFSIQNISNAGERLAFSDLAVGETLTIDCLSQTVDSNLPLVFRYNNRSSDSRFITLLKGQNHLLVKGNVKIEFKYRGQLRG